MGYLEIFLAILFFSPFLFFLISTKKTSHLFPWNWPLIKMMPTVYLKSHKLYDKMTQILAENNFTILFETSWCFTNLDILVTSDPINVQHVMNSKFSIYQRGSQFRKAFDFLGESVFIKDLDEWREEKKFIHGFYKEIEFQKSTPKIIHYTLKKGLVPVLDHICQQNQVVDLQSIFNRYMLDATCLMATGFDLGSLRPGLPKCLFLDSMDDIAEAVFFRHILPEKVWKLQRLLNIGKEKKMAEASKTLNHILKAFVSKKHEELQQQAAMNQETTQDSDNFDVLKFYISKLEPSKDGTENSFLAANIMTLLFAGRDTSAALMTWFFYLISTNPLAENKILEEIKRYSPKKRHIFSNVEELGKLVYLHCALYESLRLYPTAPAIIRDPTHEDVLPSGHKVGKNTKVILCSYAMGRMKEIWGEDCSEFKPERWISSGHSIKHVASCNFLAFGSGPWACVGRELGFTRMKGVVVTILHNYGVKILDGQSASPSVAALLTMRDGLKATLSSKW